jgi:hypothetical protein
MMSAYVLGQEPGLRHDIVINEDDELSDRLVDRGIARSRRTSIALRKPAQSHCGMERLQVRMRTVA